MIQIDESRTAKGFTPAALVPAAFGRKRTIEGIVIHHWGNRGQKHDDINDFFVDGPGATSAHFVVSNGRITCLVSPLDAAWHSGSALGNATTIGIECRPEATDGDYETVAELVQFIRATYGDLPLSPHRQWSSTACPGVWDLARLDKLTRGLAAIAPQGTITPQPSAQPAEQDMDMAQLILIKGKDAAIWVGNYVTRTQGPDLQTLKDLQYRHEIGEVKIANGGKVIEGNVNLAGKAV